MNGDRQETAAELESRKAFRALFCDQPEGHEVLTWILNELGYFATDPQRVDPLAVAFCNRLLNKTGVVHPLNLFEDTAARLANANDRDLNTDTEEKQ
jgi:hypothetical protein